MKITKRQLKRIIREEKQKLQELDFSGPATQTDAELYGDDEEAYIAKLDQLQAAIRSAISIALQGKVQIDIQDVEAACEQTILEFYYG